MDKQDEVITEMFKNMDTNHDGKLTWSEIDAAYVKASKYPSGKAEVAMKEWGKDKEGSISSEEFMEKFKSKPRKLCLLATFLSMDTNGNKRITIEDMTLFGAKVTGSTDPEQAKREFERVDPTHKGWAELEDLENSLY